MIVNSKTVGLLTGVQCEAVQDVVVGTWIDCEFIFEGLNLLIEELELCFGLSVER